MTESPETPTSPVEPAQQPTKARRLFVVVLLACLLLFGWYYLRGSRAATTPLDPTKPEDGIRCMLVRSDDGETEIRTAVVIPAGVEAVWKILSDYEEWEKLFTSVRRKQLSEPVGANQHHVVSDVMTPMGLLQLDFIVTHEPTAEKGYLASWNAPVPRLPVNRGSIRVTPLANDRTLLVYTVRKQYPQYPQFIVNNMLLDQQPEIVRKMRDRILVAAGTP